MWLTKLFKNKYYAEQPRGSLHWPRFMTKTYYWLIFSNVINVGELSW